MRRRKQYVSVTLNSKEMKLLRDTMLWWRNELIAKNIPTDDVDDLLIRIMKK